MSTYGHIVFCSCAVHKGICDTCSSQMAQFDQYLNSNRPVHERADDPLPFNGSPNRTLPPYLHHTILEKMDAARATFSQQTGPISFMFATQVMSTLVRGFDWLAQILNLVAVEAARGGPYASTAVVIIRDIAERAVKQSDMFFCGQGLRNICAEFSDVGSCSRARSTMTNAHTHFLAFLKGLQVACYVNQEPFILTEDLTLFVSSFLGSNIYGDNIGAQRHAAEILCLTFRPQSTTARTIGAVEIRLWKGTLQNYQAMLADSFRNSKRLTAWGQIVQALRAVDASTAEQYDFILSPSDLVNIQLGLVLTVCPYSRLQGGRLSALEGLIFPDWLRSYDETLSFVYNSRNVRVSDMHEIVHHMLGFIDDQGRFLHAYIDQTLAIAAKCTVRTKVKPFVFINILSDYAATIHRTDPDSDKPREATSVAIYKFYEQCTRELSIRPSNEDLEAAVNGLAHALNS